MTKIRLFAAALVAVLMATLVVGESVAQERIFDPATNEWVYLDDAPAATPNRRVARRALQARGSSVKRETVKYASNYAPGTIVVESSKFRLYYIVDSDTAISYGIGVGRDGFRWSGSHRISRKAEWPGWTPPPAMRKRQPELPAYMPGGPGNPLGARALYIGSTLYRLHGTSEPWTIGHQVSSGCIRLTNEDIIDLYGRVKVGARVIVRL
ncbi:L,D-transpeptidase [Cucumibacter marinus]|uniref:L,D-transpeptidase n=1 Tax=Cucumibacter marinus TaxID=1121252 RepID=UPI000405C32E|nr:L,D-transpeptidase [Cucumibacter marinus]